MRVMLLGQGLLSVLHNSADIIMTYCLKECKHSNLFHLNAACSLAIGRVCRELRLGTNLVSILHTQQWPAPILRRRLMTGYIWKVEPGNELANK